MVSTSGAVTVRSSVREAVLPLASLTWNVRERVPDSEAVPRMAQTFEIEEKVSPRAACR